MRPIIALTTAVLLACSATATAQTVTAPPATGAAIAVYSDGLSVVRESRAATLADSLSQIVLPGLPDDLDLSSLSVQVAGHPASSLQIRHDTLSPQSLLRRSIGREVVWLVPVGDTGAEREIRGTLVNVDGGILLKVGERYEAMPPEGRLALDSLPPGMTGGLEVTAIASAAPGSVPVHLRYITPNLSWSADYEAALLPDESGLRLSGHYLISNETGSDYPAATIRLVAGETARVKIMRQERVMLNSAPQAMAMADGAVMAPPQEASLGDVHVYDVAGTFDLPAHQVVRRVLLTPVVIPVEKQYRLEGSGVVSPNLRDSLQEGLRPSVSLSFDNVQEGPLATALPAGPVRVYGALASDAATAPSVVLGEDRIAHLPVGGHAKLHLGRAFDVTASRRVTDYETTGVAANRRQPPYKARHEITLTNGRDEAVTVEVHEAIYGQSWSIPEASQAAEAKDAGSATWQIAVPAHGTTVLTYTVRVTP